MRQYDSLVELYIILYGVVGTILRGHQMTHTPYNSFLLRMGRIYDPLLWNATKVMGYHSHDCAELYSKSEGFCR